MSVSGAPTVTSETAVGTLTNWRRNLVFAAPADDPRARRPVDVVVLIGSILAAALLGWLYENNADIDVRVVELFESPPSWVIAIAVVTFGLVGVYSMVLLIGIGVFGRGRLSVARDMFLASFLAVAGVLLASYAAVGGFPEVLPEVGGVDDYPGFPVVRLSGAWAAIGAAGPFLTVPLRTLGRRLVIAGAISALVLNYGTVTSVLAGLMIGIAAGAAVRTVFGSGRGIPSRSRIMASLAEAGLDVDTIEYLETQTAAATLVRVDLRDGGSLMAKVYGRDAADSALVTRTWRTVWYRGATRGVRASAIQLAEHEALSMLMVERVGARCARLVSGSRSSTDDVILVSEWLDGDDLTSRTDLDRATVDEIWQQFSLIHGDRLAHGSIHRGVIVLTDDGPAVVGLRESELLAPAEVIAADRAQLLVTTALAAGPEVAIAAARSAVDDAELADSLALIQTAAMPRQLQSDIKEVDLDLDELRDSLAAELGTDAPEMAKLYRISWGAVAMAVLTLFAGYSLVSSLTSIGLDTVGDQFANALWGWIILAFILAQLTNFGEVLSLAGVMGRPAPLGPTLLFRYALSFISLAVPSDAGAVAMSVRYQQKLGVPAAAAVAQGPMLLLVSKGMDIVLLLLGMQVVGRTIDFSDVDFGSVVDLVIVIVVLVVIGIIVTIAVPSFRRRVMPHVREGFHSVKGSVTDPHRLGKMLVGSLIQKILFALTLSASVSAFGGDLSFASAIVVNTLVSLFIGLMPVPGGIGVGESAITAGLIIMGIPEEAAFAAAITHRMVTAYIPPVLGWWASRWLTRNSYL